MTTRTERVSLVLHRMREQVLSDDYYAEAYAEMLEHMLDMLGQNDVFGTEGQSDPRGDQRNGLWTIDRVEGLDKR